MEMNTNNLCFCKHVLCGINVYLLTLVGNTYTYLLTSFRSIQHWRTVSCDNCDLRVYACVCKKNGKGALTFGNIKLTSLANESGECNENCRQSRVWQCRQGVDCVEYYYGNHDREVVRSV